MYQALRRVVRSAHAGSPRLRARKSKQGQGLDGNHDPSDSAIRHDLSRLAVQRPEDLIHISAMPLLI
jgi:hypothetical protein